MEVNQHIFRANDIRGIAYEDLTEEVVTKLGKSLGSEALEREVKDFVIGRDGRLSSPDMYEWLSGGVLSTGCNVINIGIVTSPMFYHSTFVLESASGVVITGSHNPGEYNGFKVVFNNQERLEDLASRVSKQIMTDSISLIKSFLDSDFLNKKGFDSLNALSMYIPCLLYTSDAADE